MTLREVAGWSGIGLISFGFTRIADYVSPPILSPDARAILGAVLVVLGVLLIVYSEREP